MADASMIGEAWRLHQNGALDQAAEIYAAVLDANPGNFDALFLLGMLHGQSGRFEDAARFTADATRVNPGAADAWFLRSYALTRLHREEEAVACLDRVLALRPGMHEARLNRAYGLFRLGRTDAAAADFQALRSLFGDHPHLPGYLWAARLQDCDWRNFDAEQSALLAGLAAGKPVVTPFHAKTLSLSLAQELACAQAFLLTHSVAPPLWAGEHYNHERIRVAYVSADFRYHPVSLLIAGVFEHHDRRRFETFGISLGVDDASDVRSRVVSGLEHFYDVREQDDSEIAALLRRLEIDIAVDLTGFTDGCRPAIFLSRPAPVQVNFLGYPGTMGRGAADYIVADVVAVPHGERQYYGEQVIYLPDTYLPNDSIREVSRRQLSRADAGLPEKGFVFCCFNNAFKISPPLFDVWMRLMRQVEGSVLWLRECSNAASTNLRKEASGCGVAPERLIFAPRIEMADHLARHRLADLFLDTTPYNAHATASDALWAGVPVLTVQGHAFAGRGAASLLHAIGMDELVAPSLQAYESMALDLAFSPEKLGDLRGRLAHNREHFPLFDTARFTRHLEGAYSTMWLRSQRGEAPQAFAVPSTD